MKQVTATTIKHSPLLTGQSRTDADNESIFAGWALPSHFDVLLYNSKARWKWWNDRADAKLWDRRVFFFHYFFYPYKYSASSRRRELLPKPLQITQPRPDLQSLLAMLDSELKAEMSCTHVLWEPQITHWLIKPWSERKEARNTWEDLASLTFPL